MKRFFILALLCVPAIGCGDSALPTTSDPDAIRREQERLGGQLPASKTPKNDAIKREQDRLKAKP